MTIAKKITISTLIIILGLLLFSCNKVTHEHQFSSFWVCDETTHWHECSCGEKIDLEVHSFTGTYLNDEDSHYQLCKCGKEGVRSNHTFNSGVITAEPTAALNGSKRFTCTVCGFTTDEIIPRLLWFENFTQSLNKLKIFEGNLTVDVIQNGYHFETYEIDGFNTHFLGLVTAAEWYLECINPTNNPPIYNHYALSGIEWFHTEWYETFNNSNSLLWHQYNQLQKMSINFFDWEAIDGFTFTYYNEIEFIDYFVSFTPNSVYLEAITYSDNTKEYATSTMEFNFSELGTTNVTLPLCVYYGNLANILGGILSSSNYILTGEVYSFYTSYQSKYTCTIEQNMQFHHYLEEIVFYDHSSTYAGREQFGVNGEYFDTITIREYFGEGGVFGVWELINMPIIWDYKSLFHDLFYGNYSYSNGVFYGEANVSGRLLDIVLDCTGLTFLLDVTEIDGTDTIVHSFSFIYGVSTLTGTDLPIVFPFVDISAPCSISLDFTNPMYIYGGAYFTFRVTITEPSVLEISNIDLCLIIVFTDNMFTLLTWGDYFLAVAVGPGTYFISITNELKPSITSSTLGISVIS